VNRNLPSCPISREFASSVAIHITASRLARSVSRMSTLEPDPAGILFTAPGKTSQIPTVATGIDRSAGARRIFHRKYQFAAAQSGVAADPA